MFWYGRDMSGWGYVLMGLSMIAFWGLIISLFVGPWTRFGRSAGATTPKQMLAARFARGEIDHDEYESRQAALHAHGHS